MELLGSRLVWAYTTMPAPVHWLWTALSLLLFSALVLPLGFKSGFLKFLPTTDKKVFIRTALTIFFVPGLSEETLFRVLLIPHPLEQSAAGAVLFWSVFSVVLFVVYHPLNARLFYPRGRGVFSNPHFLFMAGVMAVFCALLYDLSGSVWPPVVFHWIVTSAWLLFFGGGVRLDMTSRHRHGMR